MGRKRRNISEDDVQNWIEKGYGQGEGDHYAPWAKVRDVPSLGRSTRIAALRHKRIHHLYSDVETGHFLQADFAPGVTEIREQIALLPREETIEIAAELGFRHPTFPGTRVPTVMTSDLCAFREGAVGGLFVLCVKRDEALQPGVKGLARTLEKLHIEKRYWERRGVPWRLVTQCHFDAVQIQNLALLRPSGKAWRSDAAHARAAQVAELSMSPRWQHRPLKEFLEGLPWGYQMAFEALGHAVWRRWIPMDMSRPLNLQRPMLLREVPRNVA
jgi:hypothetical protein